MARRFTMGNSCQWRTQAGAIGRIVSEFTDTESCMTMMQLLTLSQLAQLLGRSTETIRKDIKRNPSAVPPRVVIPGARQLRWREADVHAWLAQHVINGGEQR